jgi:hypothetical protein
MLELLNGDSLKAEEHSNYFSPTLAHLPFIYLSSSCINEILAHLVLLGLIARLSSNHL